MSPTHLFKSTKSFYNYPCAHRQWRHEGNCALIHGYSRSFHFVFSSVTLDKCGFVVDFGELDFVKQYLEHMFDHTMLINPDDPHLEKFVEMDALGICALRIMENGVGMEGTAVTVLEYVDAKLRETTKGRCWVSSLEVRENDKNSSIYYNPNDKFEEWL